jgi:hypothetical protein
LVLLLIGIAFAYAQVDVAIDSIRFDLRMIGQSVYQARARSGKWPDSIEDLEGTAYLELPHRRALLEERRYVIVRGQGLDPDPAENRDRVLAYDNGSLFSRFGGGWACRGDLRVEYVDVDELKALPTAN